MKLLLNSLSHKNRSLEFVFVGLLLLLGGAPQLSAHSDCRRKVEKADYKLHQAIAEHGPYSRQADHWRHELTEARERCWTSSHQWWDEHGQRWRSDRDGYDPDHDGDIDRR